MITAAALKSFGSMETPFYYYDMELLRRTASTLAGELNKFGYYGHYAIKANANSKVLETINKAGIGAECASGNEVAAAIKAGFNPQSIVFAGVGKTDKEIKLSLEKGIYSLNCESMPEIEVIDSIAAAMGTKAKICVRVNPDVDAHTHKNITTGLKENKFGIGSAGFEALAELLKRCPNIEFRGLHFHVGSQILQMSVFQELALKVEGIEKRFEELGLEVKDIDLGGGLGVDYQSPETNPMPDFAGWIETIHKNIKLRPGQKLHVEPGRAMVAQSGYLISRVVYVKSGFEKKFLILDAGMNNLIRPALYDAWHHIENLSSELEPEKYDIVGPVCESSDTFAKDRAINGAKRGDLIAICSAGAYGEIMAMHYNLRDFAQAYYSDEFCK